jgi:hypothetical protein
MEPAPPIAMSAPSAPTPPPVTPVEPAKPVIEDGTKALFVRDVRADCEGEGPMKCLQVRESESEPWALFYASIAGFTYEESYAYELRVKPDESAKPAAGGASRRYRLVTVVSKTKIAK